MASENSRLHEEADQMEAVAATMEQDLAVAKAQLAQRKKARKTDEDKVAELNANIASMFKIRWG